MSQLVYKSSKTEAPDGSVMPRKQVNIATSTYRNIVRVNPDTAVSNLPLSPQKRVLWTISTAPIIPERLFVEMTIENTDLVNDLVYNDLSMIMFNGYLWDSSAQRSITLQTQAFEQLFMTQFDVDYNRHLQQTKNGSSDASGRSADYAGGVTILAGTTRTFILEIASPFSSMGRDKPLMSDLAGMKLEINFDASIGQSGPASASSCSLSSADVLIYGQQVHDNAISHMSADPSRKYRYNYFECINTVSDQITQVAGSRYNQRLYSFLNAGCAGLAIVFRSPGFSGTSNSTNFRPQTSVNLYKNGTRVLCDSDLFQDMYNLLNNRETQSYLLTVFDNIYWMPFAEGFGLGDYVDSEFLNGVLDGHIPVQMPDGQLNLSWVAGASETVQLDVFELRLRSLCLENGAFYVQDVFMSN